jgi:hypothetical protein
MALGSAPAQGTGAPSPSAGKPTRLRALGVVAGVAVVLAAFAGQSALNGGGGSAPAAEEPSPGAPQLVSASQFERQLGVRITQVTVSGGGGLIDVRYQVLDPDRAVALHESKPALVDEGTGVVADQLFMGHNHQSAFHTAETYFYLFDNPGSLVKPGARVTVVLGGLRLEHVEVG